MSENELLVPVIVLCILAVGAIFTIASLVDVLKQPEDAKFQSGGKGAWVAAILLTGVFGAFFYHAAGRPLPTGTRRVKHLVFIDSRDKVFWCRKCPFATSDRAKARQHGPIALDRMRRPDDRTPDSSVSSGVEESLASESHSATATAPRTPTRITGFELPSELAVASDAPPTPSPKETATGDFKICPDCAEEIRFAARKCRFCGYRYDESRTSV
jgi:hypothetical protein